MLHNKLKNYFEEQKEEYLKIFTDLVSIDTQTIEQGIGGGKEINGQQYLEKLLSSMGAVIQQDPILEETVQEGLHRFHEGNPGHNNEQRYNLIADFQGEGNESSLLFNGHIDTMPAGDPDKWERPPLAAVLEGGRCYGLGTSDMKAGLAAAICGVKLIQDAGIALPGKVRIVSVVDEEGGGNGSLSATMHGYNADAAVICEPTNCRIITANMGFIFFRVRVKGVSLHAGMKKMGVNAIEKAMKLIGALHELEKCWNTQYTHPELPPPSINIGSIKGGLAASAVPGECEFKLCLHYIPKAMTYESVYKEVTGALEKASGEDGWLSENPPEIEVYQQGDGFEMDRADPFVQEVYSTCRAVMGTGELAVSYTGNDARYYQKIARIPTVILGPGHPDKGHRPNEYIEIQNFYHCILVYANLILRWCR